MFNYLQKKGLLFAFVCLGLFPVSAWAQACDGQEGPLPDTPVEVGGDGSTASNPEVTCFYFRFDSDITGWPTGITMDLWHEYEGDLGIFIEACGERLNVLQRPGAVGNCSADCAFDMPNGDCGSSAMIGSEGNPEIVTFFETGTEPDNGISAGGSFGLTLDDACGVSTLGVNSFSELWSNCPEGLVEAEICFSDHATLHHGFVSNLNFLFPNPYTCGCLDETALNYDPDAGVSYGDCFYECQDWVVEVAMNDLMTCAGGDTLLLSASAPEADGPTFEWIGTGLGTDFLEEAESASTAVFIPADFVGNIVYTVTATDQYGCPQIETVNVTVSSAPTLDIMGVTAICGNDSTALMLQGGPYASIDWEHGESNDTIRVGAGTYEVTVTNAGGCPAVAEITIDAFTAQQPDIVGPDTICYTDQATLSVDTSFVSYTWSNGDSLSSITVNTPRIYTLAVVDSNGCTALDTFQLAHFDSLELALVGPAAFCPGDELTLDAPGGLSTYEWSTGDTTAQITVSSPGLIELTAIDSNSCSSNASLLVEELVAPQPEIEGLSALCPGDILELSTTSDYSSYLWSTGSEEEGISTNMPGPYTLTVTDSLGCSGITNFTLNAATPVAVDLDYPDNICPESSATIVATPGLSTYLWSTGDTTATIVVPNAGDYELTVTSVEGCTASATAQIIPFTTTSPDITGDPTLCPGVSTTLEAASGYTNYVWEDGTTGPELEVSATGSYTVDALDANSCPVQSSFDVEVLPEPSVAIDGTLRICENGSGQLSATAGFANYSWSVAGETSADLVVDTPGNYAVSATDSEGCTAIAQVNVALSSPDPQIEGQAGFCTGSSTTVMVADTFATYQWSVGLDPTTSVVEIGAEGEYFLTVTDDIGCEAVASVMIDENSLPLPQINGDLAFCEGGSTTLDGGAGYELYQWSIPGSTEQELNVSTAGNFALTVTDSNGCQGMTAVNTEINPLPNPQILGDLDFCPGGNTVLSSSEAFNSYSWSTGSTESNITVDGVDLVSLTVVDENLCTATVTAQPEFLSIIPPDILGDLNFCVDGNTTLTASTGYSDYVWSDGQMGAEATFTTPGPVSLEVMDANGCTIQEDVVLALYQEEALVLTEDAGFCQGGSTEITATGNFSEYKWSTTELTPTITVAQTGTFSITATDGNGCEVTAETEVVDYPLPQPDINGLLIFCEGFNTTLSTEESYPSYSWSNSETTSAVTLSSAGLVSVTVTDVNGCVGSDEVMLETATDLEPTILGAEGVCPGESVVLSVPEQYETFTWSTGSTNASITVDEAGTFSVSVTDGGGCTGETSVDVALFAEAQIDIVGPEDFCTGSSVPLEAVGDAGALLWSTGDDASEIMISEAGPYSVTLTDSNGCTAAANTNLAALSLPEFQMLGESEFCADAATDLTVTPSFPTYEWSNGDITETVTVSDPGPISVIVTDENGCQTEQEKILAEIPLPIADAGLPQLLDCDTDEVSLGGNTSSEGIEFLYQWSGPGINGTNANDPSPLVNAVGVYELTITDTVHNCVSSLSTVAVDDLTYTPDAEVTALDELDCLTLTIMLDGSSSDSGPQYVYQWLDGDQQVIPNAVDMQLEVDQASTYTLLVVDTITACSAFAQVSVISNEEYPSIELPEPEGLDCILTETSIDAIVNPLQDFVNLSWSTTTGSIISPANEPDLIVDAPGWYYLEAFDITNGCRSRDSVRIDQDIVPPVAVTNDDQTLFCNDESVGLSGQGSSVGVTMSYQWFLEEVALSGQNNLALTATEAGEYVLLVTNNSNGCTADSEVAVALDPSAPQLFEVTFDPPTCQGDLDGSLWVSTIEGGMSPYMYDFNGQGFSANFNYPGLGAGSYELTVEDANGCQLSTIVDLPDGNDLWLELGPDQRIEEGESTDIIPQVSIDSLLISTLDWRGGASVLCPECLVQQDIFLSESTRFFLTVTDENGCTAEDNILILIEKDRGIYVPNGFSPNNDGRNDRFYIFTDNNSVEEIELLRIFNRWGEFVWENTNFQPNDPTAGWDGTVGGMDPNPAVYVWYAEIKLRTGEKVIMKGDVTLVE